MLTGPLSGHVIGRLAGHVTAAENAGTVDICRQLTFVCRQLDVTCQHADSRYVVVFIGVTYGGTLTSTFWRGLLYPHFLGT